jgi:putative flavoprotein involved in K+ transport
VRDARDRGLLDARPMDREALVEADAVIWCTGFRSALDHLAPLGLRGRNGHIHGEPRLHLLGHGN